MMRTPDCGSPFCFLAAHGSRFFNLFRLRIDGRLLTARFEVQILGEELYDAHSGVFYFAYW